MHGRGVENCSNKVQHTNKMHAWKMKANETRYETMRPILFRKNDIPFGIDTRVTLENLLMLRKIGGRADSENKIR